MLEPKAIDKEITLSINCPLVVLNADEDRLIQATANLLANAIKLSPVGSKVELFVSADEHVCRVAVTDNGPGFTPAQAQFVFERFHAASGLDDCSREARIALPIAKRIVEEHGGTAGLTSSAGQGSTFWYELPITHALDSGSKAR